LGEKNNVTLTERDYARGMKGRRGSPPKKGKKKKSFVFLSDDAKKRSNRHHLKEKSI